MEENRNVLIVGHNSMLNELVANAIREELGLGCEMHLELEPGIVDASGTADSPALLLVDDSDQKARSTLLLLLRDTELFRQHRITAALFNIDPERTEPCEAVRGGVTGLFFHSNALDEMLQGVTTLLRGELWIPREVLVSAAIDSDRRPRITVEKSGLTMREMEVLNLVSTGATNDQIALQLCISPHTVKTHMYNIFRKIGVGNRFRAALWVTQNFGMRPRSFSSRAFAVAAGQ